MGSNRRVYEGGLRVRVAERAGVVIEDVSRNKLRFSGEAIVAS